MSRFCPLHFDGPLISGELQAQALQAFLAAGGTEEQVVSTLQSGCLHPLPESVEEMIRQWGKAARQIQMEPFYRVRTAHTGLLEELKQIPAFQPYLSEVIAPTEFLIPVSQERQLVNLLREYGYEPQVLFRYLAATENPEDEEEERPMTGLFSTKRPWDGFAVENTFPDQRDGLPLLASLPKMWTQHFQSYHPQSLRDLLKRASELELEVEMQRAGHERWQGIPQDVRVEMGYWMVTLAGKGGKVRCRLEEIERVRIVVPEYLY